MLWASPRTISTSWLHLLPGVHLRPINRVISPGPYLLGYLILEWVSRLRCFQRLSFPDVATLPCHWRDNRYTVGPVIPVLSY